MRSWLLFILVLGAFSLHAHPSSLFKNVFGPDRRQLVTKATAPWTAVGFLSSHCTGTLISEKHVLTAAHCVPTDPTTKEPPSSLRFCPFMQRGKCPKWLSLKKAWKGTERPDEERGKDWAVVELSEPVGKTHGWMKLHAELPTVRVNLVGYSGDFEQGSPSVHSNCYIRFDDEEVLLHDCHNTRGASGGPLFILDQKEAYIVAINSGERRNGWEESLKVDAYSEEVANIAIPGRHYFRDVEKILTGR